MSILNDEVNSMSEQEVIHELQEHGIQVKYKPMALIHSHGMFGEPNLGVIEEIDIYDALRKIKNRTLLSKDPFSK